MPDDLPAFPDDLLQLQRDYEAAHAAVTAYVTRLESEYAERYPDPGGKWDEDAAALRNAWTPQEKAEHQRLRDAREDARKALWAHPGHTEALAAGQWDELKYAAGAPGWPEPKKK